MIANGRHDHFRELAAIALDFPLSSLETAELDAHLASCPRCARTASGLRFDATVLRRPAELAPSYRLDAAIASAIAGRPARRSPSRTLLLVAATAMLVVAIFGAAAVGAYLVRTLKPPQVVVPNPPPVVELPSQGPFAAVMIRPPADGDATAPSTIWAVRADGTEQQIASVPGIDPDEDAAPFAPWMAMSDTGHLALRTRDGDRIGWAILELTDPGAEPIRVALPPGAQTARSYAVWGAGERLAIVLQPQSDDQAVAFVDPATGVATVHSTGNVCFANRCAAWAADGSGLVTGAGGASTGLAILEPDGTVIPFGSRVKPSSIGTRDVNASGDLLLGGTNPMDDPGIADDGLFVRAPGDGDRMVLPLGDVELADRAWAADGRGAWLLTATWEDANRPVALERFSPPSTRTPLASFVAAVDVPAPDVYAPAASFAGIAPDDSLAVIAVSVTSTEPVVFEGKLVDLRSGTSQDVDGSFVGWLSSASAPAVVDPSPAPSEQPWQTVPGLAWHLGSIPPMVGDQGPMPAAIAGGDDAYVVVGGRAFVDVQAPSGGIASAWSSADGLGWAPAAIDDGLALGDTIFIDDYPDPGLADVAWGPAGFVAVGLTTTSDPRGGATWSSPDGRAWTRTELPGAARAWPAAVTWTGSSYVVVGVVRDEGTPRAAAWRSTDGHSWARDPDSDAFDIGGYVTYPSAILSGGPADVASAPDGTLVMVGRTCTATASMDEQSTCRPLVLQSVEGDAWTRPAVPDDAGVALTSVAASSSRIVALAGGAGETQERARVMVGDAGAWRLVEPAGVPRLERVATAGAGFLAVSELGNVVSLWWSTDGESWIEVPGIPQPSKDPGWGAEMQAYADLDLAVVAGRVVIVGRNQADPVGSTAFAIVGAAGAAEASPAPSPSPALSPSPTPQPGVGSTWEAAAGVPGSASAITAGGPGWVAVGAATPLGNPAADPDFHVAAAWTSVDGRAWTRSPDLMADGPSQVVAVTSRGSELFAVGIRNLTEGIVWRSTDGVAWDVIGSGSTFDLGPCVEGCAMFSSIAAGPAGIVVVGYRVVVEGEAARSEGTIWWSSDGIEWRRMAAPPSGVWAEERVFPWGAVAGGPGFVVVGSACPWPEGTPCRAAAWTSDDGATWGQPTIMPAGDASAGDLQRVVASGGTLVAVEGRGTSEVAPKLAAWVSTDGIAWRQVSIDAAGVGSEHGPLAIAGGTLVVLGVVDGAVVAYTSTDGITWSRQEPSAAFPAADGMHVLDMAGGPPGVAILGIRGFDTDAEEAITLLSPAR